MDGIGVSGSDKWGWAEPLVKKGRKRQLESAAGCEKSSDQNRKQSKDYGRANSNGERFAGGGRRWGMQRVGVVLGRHGVRVQRGKEWTEIKIWSWRWVCWATPDVSEVAECQLGGPVTVQWVASDRSKLLRKKLWG